MYSISLGIHHIANVPVNRFVLSGELGKETTADSRSLPSIPDNANLEAEAVSPPIGCLNAMSRRCYLL